MRVIFVLLVWTSAAFAEDFRFEITANYWPLNPTGTVLTPTDHVDLKINVVDADFHNGGNIRGFKLRFAGPIFAVQIHD